MLLQIPTGPLLWLPLTLAGYLLAVRAQAWCHSNPLLNPTLVTLLAIAALLEVTGTPHRVYLEGVAILDYLLGACVVALAVPLHGLLARFGARTLLYLPALVLGSLVSVGLGLAVATSLGVSATGLATAAPKSATTAVSMEIARMIGGVPALTALLTIASGILGAVVGPSLLSVTGATSPAARGIAYGTASHGIATARAFTEDEETGAWSTLAMCLNALLTAAFVPMVFVLLEVLVR